MKTKRPIASISYLTHSYLELCLNKAISEKVICFWAYIPHFADEDGNGKEHSHVFVIPTSIVDTDTFRDRFIEIVPCSLPLRTMNWFPSKFDDWYLYSLHDVDYLTLKGLIRQFHYKKEDMKCSDIDEFCSYVARIDYSQIVNLKEFISYASNQYPIREAIKDGVIPLSSVYNMSRYVNLYKAIKTDTHQFIQSLKYGGNDNE